MAILHFGYSDPSTVPTLVPAHVRAKAFNLPADANEFLCQLLDVKKRELCPLLPIKIIRPKVRVAFHRVIPKTWVIR